MQITRIAQSCFLLEFAGKITYTDPFKIPNGSPQADIILVSHPHPDHFDQKSLAKILNEGTTVICPKSCPKILAMVKDGRGVRPGDEITIGDVGIEAVPAYNQKKPFHARKKAYVGFVLTGESRTLYHAGDTDWIPEMADLATKSIDIAFLPIGGMFTMDMGAAIKAVKAINPRIVIPMHEMKKDLRKFADLLKGELPGVEAICLRSGDTYEL